MKLNEIKTLNEEAIRAKLKEMYPHATEAQLDEAVPHSISKGIGAGARMLARGARAAAVGTQATVAKGAKAAGQAAVAGAKKAAPVVGKVAKQAGAVAAKAGKAVGKEAGAAYKGAKEIGKNVVSMSGDAAKVAKTAAAQKMQQQKAGMGAKLAGGKNAQKFTRGVQDLEGGKAIRADLAQELKPHITNLQNILANPQLRVKWLQLVKQANQSAGK